MAIALKRRRRPPAAISVVSMIDVLMILLIFFMVTSTYLDLDMVPALDRAEEDGAPPAAPAEGPARVMMIRIGQDGSAHVQGQRLEAEALTGRISQALAGTPGLELVLLPSAGARMQDLVTVMDLATRAGATRVRVIRLESQE